MGIERLRRVQYYDSELLFDGVVLIGATDALCPDRVRRNVHMRNGRFYVYRGGRRVRGGLLVETDDGTLRGRNTVMFRWEES